jgi:hypothetical protein
MSSVVSVGVPGARATALRRAMALSPPTLATGPPLTKASDVRRIPSFEGSTPRPDRRPPRPAALFAFSQTRLGVRAVALGLYNKLGEVNPSAPSGRDARVPRARSHHRGRLGCQVAARRPRGPSSPPAADLRQIWQYTKTRGLAPRARVRLRSGAHRARARRLTPVSWELDQLRVDHVAVGDARALATAATTLAQGATRRASWWSMLRRSMPPWPQKACWASRPETL